MKTLYIALTVAALSASPAFAGYQTHSSHNYNGASAHTGSSSHSYGAPSSNYGASKDTYNGAAPKTGSPTHAYTSPTALSTAVPY